jgi:hypothetical protein
VENGTNGKPETFNCLLEMKKQKWQTSICFLQMEWKKRKFVFPG